MHIKIEDTSFSEVSSFIHTEFRRIYGVVFRTFLHGEATDYLLVDGPTSRCIINTCSGLGVNLICIYCAYCRKQTNYDNDAEAQRQAFTYPLLG